MLVWRFCTLAKNKSANPLFSFYTSLTFESWLSSELTGLTSWVRVCSQLSSLARRTKVSPSKQSSARGNNFLANGSGWQHQSSTMAFQLPLGRGRTRLKNLIKRKNNNAITGFLFNTVLWYSENVLSGVCCSECCYLTISTDFPEAQRRSEY